MAQSKQALRSRIKSVNSTRKITKAMEMIANAKLFRQRSRMEDNRSYASKLHETVDEIISSNPNLDQVYLKPRKSEKKMTIVFCSDLGLCGSYNQNTLRMVKENLKPEDPVVLIGTSLYHQMEELGYQLVNKEPVSSDKLEFLKLKDYMRMGEELYLKDEVGAIQVLYTKFVNTMKFEPVIDQLLPVNMENYQQKKTEEKPGEHVETLFEPDPETILDDLIPMMIEDVAYSHWLETTTSEQGSRRVAIKTATDNADDLSAQLLLEYNKARQAAITQEITEVINGSSAV